MTKFTLEQIDAAINIIKNGFGYRALKQPLKLGEHKARQLAQEIKAGAYGKIKVIKQNTAYRAKELADKGYSNYDIANTLGTTVTTIVSNLERSEDNYKPAERELRRILEKGASCKVLKTKFGFRSKEEIRKAIKESYPGCFISEIKEQDDVVFTPVVDTTDKLNWLNIDTSKKLFKFSINEAANYMMIMFNDDVPFNEIQIYHLTDIHIGSKAFRRDIFVDLLERIRLQENAFITLGGDLIEAITKLSVADPNEQYESINDQVTETLKLLTPVAHKILASEWGNHCGGRTEKVAEFDLSKVMAQMLRVPYFRSFAIIDLVFRGVRKRISITHKYGNAFTQEAIVREVRNIQSFSPYWVDAYFSGHNHSAFIHPENAIDIVPGKGPITKEWYICNGGSFTVRTGTYVEKAGYAPKPQDAMWCLMDDQDNFTVGRIPFKSI